MNDWGLSVLDQYSLNVRSVRKVRGALLCDTQQGLFLLQEYRGSQERLQLEVKLLDFLEEEKICQTDVICRSAKGEISVKNEDESCFVLKRWYPMQECNVASDADLSLAVSMLAGFHKGVREFQYDHDSLKPVRNFEEACERHNRELRRVSTYLWKKKKKLPIEKEILKSFAAMYDQAQQTLYMYRSAGLGCIEQSAEDNGFILHGSYHQHNVLAGVGSAAAVNFEMFARGWQLRDLYEFIRKILEKNNWDRSLGIKLIKEYSGILPISDKEIKLLSLMIRYPEKYWKQVNFYFNNNKSWISDKNMEKLKKAVGQTYVRTAFADYLD